MIGLPPHLRMCPDPTEQDSYSLDEMIERLREGEREKREAESSTVVTRPDGSKVRRVRKRKRVNEAAAKKASRRRPGKKFILLVFSIGVMVVVRTD